MATQNNEPLTTASSRASLVDYPDGGLLSKYDQVSRRSRRRACPVIALLGLLLHFAISGLGVAISVLVVQFNLQVVSAGSLDLVARILLFVASCMSIFYVLMHAFAAREHYVRSHGSPQIFGYFTVAVAVLIMRIGVPVWIGSMVLTALVAANKGFNVEEGLRGNVVWIQLGIASLGLLTLIIMVVITETTERPFATSLFSKKSFIKSAATSLDRVDTFDLSVSRAGFRPEGKKNEKDKSNSNIERDVKQMGFDRSTINTPESPALVSTDVPAPTLPAQEMIKSLVRVRSQPFPTPLAAVFTSEGSQLEAQDSPRKLAWRPPRESIYAPQEKPQIAVPGPTPRLPSGLRQPQGATPPEPSSPRSSVESQSNPASGDISTVSAPAPPTLLPSPALGTPTAVPVSAPLWIANPDERPAQLQQEAPTLAKLLGQLSSRAAARRRNSLLVRQADLNSKAALETGTRAGSATDMTAVLFDQPADSAKPAGPERRNSVLVRQTDLDARMSVDITRAGDMSVVSLDPSTEFVEIPRPPEVIPRRAMTVKEGGDAAQAPSLVRSNTVDPMLVRNFSRPGAPRPRTAGSEDDGQIGTQTADRQSRGNSREEKALARRSRSLPPTRQGRSTMKAGGDQFERNRNTSRSNKGKQLGNTPRFSPFPRTPVAESSVGPAKVKGLGQGSTRRLDARVAKWRDGVVDEDE